MEDILKALSTLKIDKDTLEIAEDILNMADELCKKDIEPYAREWNEEGVHIKDGKVIYPKKLLDAVKKMADNGLLGLGIPEEYGGAGLPTAVVHAFHERVSRADASISLIPLLQATVSEYIMKFGSDMLKEKYLPELAEGKVFSGLLYTEPTSGSDLGSLKSRAEEEGDSFLISGTKIFITNAGLATLYSLLASTDPSKGSRGLTAFILDTRASDTGFEILRVEEKLGLHASGTGQIFMDKFPVPKENMLGQQNKGFSVILHGLAASRIGIGAQAVGIADAAYRRAATYVAERKQFGRRILDFQVTQFKLADMATKISTARQMYLYASQLKDLGKQFREEASMAKLYASEMGQQVCYEALQLLGGYGYVTDYDVERYYRDIRITSIYEGTSEVQRIVISRDEMAKIEKFNQ